MSGLTELTMLVLGLAGAIEGSPLIDTQQNNSPLMELSPSGFVAQIQDEQGNKKGKLQAGGTLGVVYGNIPAHLISALIAIEDHHFFEHSGVDPSAIIAALISSLKGDVRGGSTIHQQLAKNAFTGNKSSISRKIREANISMAMHSFLGRQEVLRRYLQTAWFGRGATGIAEAAYAWFDVALEELSLEQSALLVAMLKGPEAYNPERHPQKAKARRNLVLDQMAIMGAISEAEATMAKSMPLLFAEKKEGELSLSETQLLQIDAANTGNTHLTSLYRPEWHSVAADALSSSIEAISPVVAPVRLSNEEIEGLRDQGTLPVRYTSYLPAHSTLLWSALEMKNDDGSWQILTQQNGREASVKVTSAAANYTPHSGDVVLLKAVAPGHYEVHPKTQLEGAAVVIDTQTGAVLASVGSANEEMSSFNRVNAMRQPGSTVKPFLWLAALHAGLSPYDYISDAEMTYTYPDGSSWTPENYDHSEVGFIPLFAGLEWSSNTVAANLASQIGLSEFQHITTSAGIYSESFTPTPASILGASETSLIKLTAAYSGLAREGFSIGPYTSMEARGMGRQFASPYDIRSLLPMLRGVVERGTASDAFRGSDLPIIGKSGTSQNHKDAWFVGITPEVTVGVWIGRDDAKPMAQNMTGGHAAAPVVRDIIDQAYALDLLREKNSWWPALYEDRFFTMPTKTQDDLASSDPSAREPVKSELELMLEAIR